MFDTVLIANRGEIACRIIRTLRSLGLRSVAVFSDADAESLHVKLADETIHIGPSPVNESYLRADKIIAAAQMSGAQAIHPGYGFLSENADFARDCVNAGLTFIGPSAAAIELMGDKATAKRRMIKAGVPTLLGYQAEIQDDDTLIAEAKNIGFPLMVKAAAGGGGRGMRLVENDTDLPRAILSARAEALSAFGSDVLILERAVMRPRHVEVQVFGDSHGNIIHLGERDCSVQRRHQKVLEEAPCPILTPDLRALMGDAAVSAARTVEYVGAGTVEFLLDDGGEFFFLEMNTRLQVEHPVTEYVTGLDLVALQIRVAQGKTLGLTQEDIRLTGHAIEARLYAEDTANGFLPATGRVSHLSFPNSVRVDSGIECGADISPFYDPMIAKIIAYGSDRNTARRKLVRALKDTALFGVETNKRFLIDALEKPAFVAGDATTAFISEQFSEADLASNPLNQDVAVLAAVTQFLAARSCSRTNIPEDLLGWSSAHPLVTPYQFEDYRVEIKSESPRNFSIQINAETHEIRLEAWGKSTARYRLNGRRIDVVWQMLRPAEIHIQIDGHTYHLTNTLAVAAQTTKQIGKGDIRAPLHGALTEIFVAVGDSVEVGTRLAVIEAMKMQHDILSDINGTVETVLAEAGTQVGADAPLFTLKP